MTSPYCYLPGVITVPTGENVELLYYIVSRERLNIGQFSLCWWRADETGYTDNLSEAGKYTAAEVARIVEEGRPDRRPRAGDFGVPCDLAELMVSIASYAAAGRE